MIEQKPFGRPGFACNLLIGGVSGAIAEASTSLNEKFTGLSVAHFMTSSKQKGSVSFWREHLKNIFKCAPFTALSFTFNDHYARFLQRSSSKSSIFWSMFSSLIAGSAAGVSTLTFEFPLESTRMQLVMAAVKRQPLGSRKKADFCFKLLKAQGISSFYQGFTIALYRVALYRGLYFGGYNIYKKSVFDTQASIVLKFMFAAMISASAYFVASPFELTQLNSFHCAKSARSVPKDALSYFWETLNLKTLLKGTDTIEGMAKHIIPASLAMILYSELHLMLNKNSIEY